MGGMEPRARLTSVSNSGTEIRGSRWLSAAVSSAINPFGSYRFWGVDRAGQGPSSGTRGDGTPKPEAERVLGRCVLERGERERERETERERERRER